MTWSNFNLPTIVFHAEAAEARQKLIPLKKRTSVWMFLMVCTVFILAPFDEGTRFLQIPQISKAHSRNPWGIPRNSSGMHNQVVYVLFVVLGRIFVGFCLFSMRCTSITIKLDYDLIYKNDSKWGIVSLALGLDGHLRWLTGKV